MIPALSLNTERHQGLASTVIARRLPLIAPYYQYSYAGEPDRLGGRFIASHIRIEQGGPVPDYVHFHKIRFQMIYMTRGWVLSWFSSEVGR